MSHADLSARTFAPTSIRQDEHVEVVAAPAMDRMSGILAPVRTPFSPTGRGAERSARPARGGLAIPQRARETPPQRPTDEAIRLRAREICLARNGEEGNAVVDWLEAETQLFAEWREAQKRYERSTTMAQSGATA